MKKLLGILVLSLLWCNISEASSINYNFKGIKEFKLKVTHDGKCQGESYKKELNTTAKYIIGNSKIKLSEKASEYLDIYVLTVSSPGGRICASGVEIESYSVGKIKNSSGNTAYGKITSYQRKGVMYHDQKDEHKRQVLNQLDSHLKEFVVEWMEAQK